MFSSKLQQACAQHGGARANSGGARANSGGARPNSGPKRIVYLVRPDAERWYCLRSDWAGEETAALEIGIAGFEVFAPTIWTPARAARRDGRSIRPARPAQVESMFHRYLFARFRRTNANLQEIRALPGVDCILGTAPDAPIAMPDDAIEIIRKVCSANGCQYPADVNLQALHAPLPIAVGAATRMLGGPMADLAGICQWSSSQRVAILLQILGRDVRVTVPRAAVEAA